MKRHILIYGLLAAGLLIAACESFLEIEPPNSQMGRETVFRNEGTAIGALNGLYHTLFNGYAGGSVGSVTINAGLSADELLFVDNTGGANPYVEINENGISGDNTAISSLWANMYAVIYSANAIIDGISGLQQLPVELVSRIKGEACFVRAFTYFYLVNLFGEVPAITGTDYRENAMKPLLSRDEIYDLITSDLEEAFALLGNEYVDAERFQPNRSAVRALQARVALYNEDWAAASELAGEVIEQEGLYRIAPLNEVFLKAGGEAIWQRMPFNTNTATGEAALFFSIAGTDYTATEWLLRAFDPNDGRLAQWIMVDGEAENRVIRPAKYRSVTDIGGGFTEIQEYSIILRLAEQYLIRAEARAQLGDLPGAIADLDVIRGRAGLPLLNEIRPDVSTIEIMDIILKERQRELFTEWGHRWLDLKRTGRAMELLGARKSNLTADDLFYPIPENERLRNPNLNR